MTRIVVIDFANLINDQALNQLPTREELKKQTGLPETNQLLYTTNTYEDTLLSTNQLTTQLHTTLHQQALYKQAKQQQNKLYKEGVLAELNRIQALGYELAILANTRTDTITGILAITGQQHLFKHVHGQPPMLGVSKESQLRALASKGKICYLHTNDEQTLQAAQQQQLTTTQELHTITT